MLIKFHWNGMEASVKSVVGCSACSEPGWGVLVCTKTVWWLQKEAL